LSTPEKKTLLLLSMSIRCWDELVRYGALEVLGREYGALLQGQAEPEYNVSLLIDLEQAPVEPGSCLIRSFVHSFIHSFHFVPSRPFVYLSIYLIVHRANCVCTEAREAFVTSIALFKRHALAAPFELGFKTQKELEASGGGQGELMQIHYRDEEAIYVQAAPDRVTVIFSTIFQEETDRIFGKVFLQVRCRHSPIFFGMWRSEELYRNLWTRDANHQFRMRLRFCTRTGTRLSKSDTSLDCVLRKTLVM
jgi:actin related protein 2/3 complex subunit 2